MKAHSLSCFAVAILCLALTGCRDPHKTTHLSHGYEEVVHKSRPILIGDEPPPSRVSFQYTSPEGKLTHIWPSLYGAGEVIHDDLAIFVGDTAFSDQGTPTLRPRLFAVIAPALPVDITDEILAHWAKDSGNDAAQAVQRFNVVVPEESNGKLLLHLEFLNQDYLEARNFPDKSDFKLTWPQVTNIMDAVKAKGVYKQDPGFHTPYIGKRF